MKKTIETISEDGKTILYQFELETAADVVHLLTSAADVSENRLKHVNADHHTAMVLRAQADMIAQGLHIRGLNAPDMMLDVEAFHQKFGLEYNGKPRMLEGELSEFRQKFMQEELDEYAEEQVGLEEALTSEDGGPDHRRIAHGLHQQLDALVDEMYVVLGTAYLQFGVEVVHEAWRRVHAANMAKVRAESADQSKRGSTFDVVKPKGWLPPDHHDLVRDHAHAIYRHRVEAEGLKEQK